LYDQLIGSDYQMRNGDMEYTKWREFEEEQQKDKEQFIKARALTDEFKRYTLLPQNG